MIRKLLKQTFKAALRPRLRRWLDEPSADPTQDPAEDEDIEPFWAYMVPVPPHPEETTEQTIARVANLPDVVAVRRMRGCQCGLEVIMAVIPANLTDEQALLAVEHPKMLPGDVFLELWDPVVMRNYDHQGVQDFWTAHNRRPHQDPNQARGVIIPIPLPGGRSGSGGGTGGGTDGGSAPPN